MHDSGILQWTTHCQIAVHSHDHKQDTFSGLKPQEDIELNCTASVADGLLWTPEINQQLWNTAAGETDLAEIGWKESNTLGCGVLDPSRKQKL